MLSKILKYIKMELPDFGKKPKYLIDWTLFPAYLKKQPADYSLLVSFD